MTRQVRAIANGFYRGSRVRAGQVFSVPSEMALGKWMEEVSLSKTGAAKEAAKEPETFSAVNKLAASEGPKAEAVKKALAGKTPAKADDTDALV